MWFLQLILDLSFACRSESTHIVGHIENDHQIWLQFGVASRFVAIATTWLPLWNGGTNRSATISLVNGYTERNNKHERQPEEEANGTVWVLHQILPRIGNAIHCHAETGFKASYLLEIGCKKSNILLWIWVMCPISICDWEYLSDDHWEYLMYRSGKVM